jgi:membrane-bound ClpP family serine protease
MSVTTLFIIVICLLIAEIIIFSMGIFGFLAFCAFVYALFVMHQSGMTDFHGVEFEIIAISGFSIFTLFAVGGYYAYKSFNKKISVGLESMIGNKATIKEWKNNSGKILFEGELWRATSQEIFEIDETCIIKNYNHMTLTIEKDPQ